MERKQEKVALSDRRCEHKNGNHWNFVLHQWDCDKCYKLTELSNYLPQNPQEFKNLKSAFERTKNTA